MNAMSLRKMIVAIALVGISAGYVRADKMQLQEKLSKNVSIQLKDVTIAESLEKIGQKAGVKFVLSDEATWKLPYGEATRLSVALDGPLADSMTEMLNAFFMRYAVGNDEVAIYPKPEMEHILGRPTTKQLELLKAIYTRPIKVYFFDQLQKTMNEALGQEILISPVDVHGQLNILLCHLAGVEAKYPFQVAQGRVQIQEQEPNKPEPTELGLPTPVTLVQLLSQVRITEGSEVGDAKWYISGMDFPGQSPEVRVVGDTTFKGLKLNQKVDVSYKDEQVNKILQDLASRAGVELVVEKRSFLHEYTLSANMQNITIEQAVRNIADMVGADCRIYSFINIIGPGPKTEPPVLTATPGKADDGGYVGKISIPMDGGKYFLEFMLRECDLTDELKKLRTEKISEILGTAQEVKPPQKQPEK
jgi:hypothetical protein